MGQFISPRALSLFVPVPRLMSLTFAIINVHAASAVCETLIAILEERRDDSFLGRGLKSSP
jgi:hypothetical protein